MEQGKLQNLAAYLRRRQSESIITADVIRGELVVEAVLHAVEGLNRFLLTDALCMFSSLIDITAVDHPGREKRFDVVYHYLSMERNQRLRVRIAVREGEAVPSIVKLHPSANWFEREVYDMYGIMFSNHPDLRRILTDYGFEGFPLRKDFPTTGYTEVRYDEERKKVVYEPVDLVQEYRRFDFMSPWEGADYVMEKESG